VCAWGLRFGSRTKDGQRLQEHAGQYADVETLHTLFQLKLPKKEHVVIGAFRSRDLPKVTWLCGEMACKLPEDCTGVAAEAGSVELLKWLQQQGYEFDEDTTNGAASRPDNILVLQFLLDEGCPWHPDICHRTVSAGDLEQLQWLSQHGAALHPGLVHTAAAHGALHILEWMLQQPGAELDVEVMMRAAACRHLELCKWLHAAGCPCDEHACAAAADNSQLSTLRFLHENVCPAGLGTWRNALSEASFGSADVLQYLMEHAVLTAAADLTEALEVAGEVGVLVGAQHLRQQGAEWPIHLNKWRRKLIAWAQAEGYTAPDEAPEGADDDGDY
jgi:hypothetical protein